jgi:hypothetical protein
MALSGSRLYNVNGRMTDEFERIWKKASVAKPRYYFGIFLEGMRKITKKNSFWIAGVLA